MTGVEHFTIPSRYRSLTNMACRITIVSATMFLVIGMAEPILAGIGGPLLIVSMALNELPDEYYS